MQTFEIKRGHGKTLEDGGLKNMMEEEFGSVKIDNDCKYYLFDYLSFPSYLAQY